MAKKLEGRIYKIYINERPLIFASKADVESVTSELSEGYLKLYYRPRAQTLLNCIDILEKAGQNAIILYNTGSPKEIYTEFKALFKVVRAAGGVVRSDFEQTILMIYRRGHWDLPKGKIEIGETKKEAAIREVSEETGLFNIELGKKLITTRHTFKNGKGQRVLKINTWYCMSTPVERALVPQKEENIKKAEWVTIDEAYDKSPIFHSIEDVLLAFKNFPGNY